MCRLVYTLGFYNVALVFGFKFYEYNLLITSREVLSNNKNDSSIEFITLNGEDGRGVNLRSVILNDFEQNSTTIETLPQLVNVGKIHSVDILHFLWSMASLFPRVPCGYWYES